MNSRSFRCSKISKDFEYSNNLEYFPLSEEVSIIQFSLKVLNVEISIILFGHLEMLHASQNISTIETALKSILNLSKR